MENRQRIFRGVAGAYLTYLGISLVKGFIQQDPGSKLFMVFIGAAFIILGVGLLAWVARDVFGEKKEEEKPDEKE